MWAPGRGPETSCILASEQHLFNLMVAPAEEAAGGAEPQVIEERTQKNTEAALTGLARDGICCNESHG